MSNKPQLIRPLANWATLTIAIASRTATAGVFDKMHDAVTSAQAVLVAISVAVVAIAIIWAGFKMIFQGARLAHVANILIGGTLIACAAVFASLMVT